MDLLIEAKLKSTPFALDDNVVQCAMSHLMKCVDAPNCTWTDLAMPTIAGVNCAKQWEEYI